MLGCKKEIGALCLGLVCSMSLSMTGCGATNDSTSSNQSSAQLSIQSGEHLSSRSASMEQATEEIEQGQVAQEVSEAQKLVPVSSTSDFTYNHIAPIVEEAIATYTSKNGLVRIEKKPSYYEVYLDLEKGSHYDVGYAYGEAIRAVYPDFTDIMEPYLYENIYATFPELTEGFSPIIYRMEEVMKSLPVDYKEEMLGMAEALVWLTEESVEKAEIHEEGKNIDRAVDKDAEGMLGAENFIMDGKLSTEEALLMHLVPDVLRGTQCSGVAVYGDKSATGQTITVRLLEWLMGNENQMATAHAVVHFQNGEKSFTSYGILGLLQMISGSNAEGVFVGILDSETGGVYEVEDKRSYPFELRYAIEHFSSAKEVGEYMISHGKAFTFSHNILITDAHTAYVVENNMDEGGKTSLRTADSNLMNSIDWNHSEAIAVVNSFALEGNKDNMTDSDHNMIRWKKFNERLAEHEKISVGDLKDIVTRDNPNQYGAHIYSDYTYQMIVIDSVTGSVEIAFAPTSDEFPVKPDFIRVTENLYEDNK